VADDVADALLLTGIKDTEVLVAAGRGEEAAVVVPGDGLDDLRVAGAGEEVLALLDIPDLDGKVAGGGGEDVGSAGVEVHSADLALVGNKGLDGSGDVLGKSFLRHLHDSNSAVLRAGGNELIVEGSPVDVENSRLVHRDKRDVSELAGLVVAEDTINTSTSALPEKGKVLGIGSNKVAVPVVGGELDAADALLGLGSLTKDVTELGLTNEATRHVQVVVGRMLRE